MYRSEAASFSLGGGVPSRLSVFVQGEEVAQINRRFSLTSPATHVLCTKARAARIRRSGGEHLQ